ncbi:MAG: NUDIX domain-containing protein [Lewinella sp.]|nr:NUDIX domain-containing protein [Lewinella sp.]
MQRVRTAVKAIILHEEQLLCNVYHDERGRYYALPGGGQEYQEDLEEALHRECREEISAAVEVHELLFVRDFIGQRNGNLARLRRMHQLDLFFRCSLQPGETPQLGMGADHNQVDVAWVPIGELRPGNFFPYPLVPWLTRLDDPARPVYLGAVD